MRLAPLESPARASVLDPAVAESVRVAVRQIDRLARLVEDLLDFSRIRAGRLELGREPVDLVGVAREVVSRLEDDAARLVSLDAAGAGVGLWDRGKLDQIVTNLVSNALKYGDGKPVVVTLRAQGGDACLDVRDQGIGIAPEHHATIFDPFERAPSGRGRHGVGLGLYIVREIVGAFGGSIDVVSEPGAGATFRVRLPGLLAEEGAARVGLKPS
jgi:signal transduction histidine kinase